MATARPAASDIPPPYPAAAAEGVLSRFADLDPETLSAGEWLDLAAQLRQEQQQVRQNIESRYSALSPAAGQTRASLQSAKEREIAAALASYAPLEQLISTRLEEQRALVRRMGEGLDNPDVSIVSRPELYGQEVQPANDPEAEQTGLRTPFYVRWWFWLGVVAALAAVVFSA